MKDARRPAPRWIEVDEAHGGQRLDNFLHGRLKGVPRSHIYRIVRRGEVRINRGRCRPHTRLRSGDMVRIPPLRTAADRPGPRAEDFHWLAERIVFEDEHCLVLDKPAGLAVHRGTGVDTGVVEALRALYPNRYLELVHRLDRGTSGCLVLAGSGPALRALHEAWRDGQVEKHYTALVCGRWDRSVTRIDVPLLRSPRGVVPGSGQTAVTEVQVAQRLGDLTLVDLRLRTGRTHQARVHAAWAGCPVAGDARYGEWTCNRRLRAHGLRRLFLHAASVAFRHPVSGHPMTCSAPLPAELTAVLEALG